MLNSRWSCVLYCCDVFWVRFCISIHGLLFRLSFELHCFLMFYRTIIQDDLNMVAILAWNSNHHHMSSSTANWVVCTYAQDYITESWYGEVNQVCAFSWHYTSHFLVSQKVNKETVGDNDLHETVIIRIVNVKFKVSDLRVKG